MTDVYMLHHEYAINLDNGETIEETKFTGVYSTEAKAREAIAEVKDQPGFRDHPDGFHIYDQTLDATSWREGFIRPSDDDYLPR